MPLSTHTLGSPSAMHQQAIEETLQNGYKMINEDIILRQVLNDSTGGTIETISTPTVM